MRGKLDRLKEQLELYPLQTDEHSREQKPITEPDDLNHYPKPMSEQAREEARKMVISPAGLNHPTAKRWQKAWLTISLRLPEIITTMRHAKELLSLLNEKKSRTAVFEVLQAHLPGMVRTGRTSDVTTLSQWVTADEYKRLLEALKNEGRLPELMGDTDSFSSVFDYLRLLKSDALHDYLPMLVKTACFSRIVFNHLKPDERIAVFKALEQSLSDLIKTANDFNSVLSWMNADQRTTVFQKEEARLPDLIQTVGDFRAVIIYLNPDQKMVVFEAVKSRLPNMIETVTDVASVFNHLNTDQRATVFEAIKSRLPDMIETVTDVASVFNYLNTDQRATVFQAIQTRLRNIVKTIDLFEEVFSCMPENAREAMFQAIKTHLLTLINTVNDLNSVLSKLNENQRTVIFHAVESRLPDMIATETDFKFVFFYLNTGQKTAVLQAVKNRLPHIIKTADNFKSATSGRDKTLLTGVIIETLEAHLSSIVETVEDLKLVLENLTDRTHRERVYKALGPHLARLGTLAFLEANLKWNQKSELRAYYPSSSTAPTRIDVTGIPALNSGNPVVAPTSTPTGLRTHAKESPTSPDAARPELEAGAPVDDVSSPLKLAETRSCFFNSEDESDEESETLPLHISARRFSLFSRSFDASAAREPKICVREKSKTLSDAAAPPLSNCA